MKCADPVEGRPVFSERSGQRGQALVYGLFMIVASVAALFFLFNTGQLSQEKTKLVNTADAVAYSAGLMDARTLNFLAYTNRAMLANTVAIAQLVSLSSWASYMDQLSNGVQEVWYEKYFAADSAWITAQYSGSYLNEYLNESGILEQLAKQSDETFIKDVLVNAQDLAYNALAVARPGVMKEVAEANYRDDGTASVESLLTSTTNFHNFVSQYSDDERTRFAEVAVASAKSDGFVKSRSWRLFAVPWIDQGCTFILDWINRRGGTDLIGFDEWKAMDTLSEYRWFDFWDGCAGGEMPRGYGATVAADASESDTDMSRYDMARVPFIGNPGAAWMADNSSNSWGYTGLPEFYDLSEDDLEKEDPRLRHAVGLKRKISETRTSEGVSQIRNSGDGNRLAQTLNNYQAAPADDGALTAASAVEVYFDRGSENPYGQGKFGKSKEIGSLFNPFWHVHLVTPTVAERTAAAGAAVLP
jgi:hypothetical protein